MTISIISAEVEKICPRKIDAIRLLLLKNDKLIVTL